MAFFDKSTGLALVLGVAFGLPATAQGIPAEFPPRSFEGNQYVDSEGCAFIRAGMDGATNWVPRVDRQRNQLCSFQPTFAQAAPEPAPAAVAEAPVVTATAPAPTPTPRISPVIRTPAAAPVVTAPAPRSAPTPRVVRAAPKAAPQLRRITLAEACSGRFGVQPGFVSARTGDPIDCGGAPERTASAAPTAVRTREPLRLTLDQACARIAAGANLVTPDGAPIACPQADPVRVATAVPLTIPRGIPASNANACSISRLAASEWVRCGPQAISPSGQVTRSLSNPATAPVSPRSVGSVAARVPSRIVPAPQVPSGYDRVWDDGRLNTQRGLPAPAVQPRVSTRTVAPAATPVPRATATGHRYVQVGSFGDPNNATRLIARLQAAGLPVASGRSGNLKIVAAGPFASASDLNRALGIVRTMGFSDAYTRG